MSRSRKLGTRRGEVCKAVRETASAIAYDPLLAAPSIIVVGLACAVAVTLILLS